MKKIFVVILLLITSLNSYANDQMKELDELFIELKNGSDHHSSKIEEQIWNIWTKHPTNQNLTLRLEEGSILLKNQEFLKAMNIFSEIINQDPKWAEAWNKRATVLYLMGDYQGSQNDINKVLELEKRHFGALSGQGLVNIKLENYEKAIDSYKKAKEIYPTMQSPNIMINYIQELIKQQLI